MRSEAIEGLGTSETEASAGFGVVVGYYLT
jgi:hypothetical protein